MRASSIAMTRQTRKKAKSIQCQSASSRKLPSCKSRLSSPDDIGSSISLDVQVEAQYRGRLMVLLLLLSLVSKNESALLRIYNLPGKQREQCLDDESL